MVSRDEILERLEHELNEALGRNERMLDELADLLAGGAKEGSSADRP